MAVTSRSTPDSAAADGAAVAGASVPADPLGQFGPVTREWFTGAFSAPTPAQAGAWASIAAGNNSLVVAPTGSGKTLAAFLWALDRLASEPIPADPKLRCRVLYISPLKALAVDIERNLRAPLTGMRQVTQRHGLPEPDIRVAVRTGDTAADERRKLSTKPPDILITTPESLFLILTSRARETLCGVDTVIVDEVHALAGNKRGAHLALSLERLDALGAATRAARAEARSARVDGQTGSAPPYQNISNGKRTKRKAGDTPAPARSPARSSAVDSSPAQPGQEPAAPGPAGPGRPAPAQRIGLSATVRPAEEVAAFLGGSQPVTITAPPSTKQIELRIVVPVEDMTDPEPPPGARPPGIPSPADPGAEENPAGRSIWPHVEQQVLDLIEAHRSTIVFANSRRLAERLCGRLNELAADRAQARQEALEKGLAAAPPSWGAPGAAPPAEMMAQAGVAAGAPPEVARAHHGSVSRQERVQIEEALKAGRLPAVVATSSLELGIDMGAVDLVIQVESPPSVASGLQRTGRAGHRVGDVSRSVIFPKYPGDLVQAAVVAQRMREGDIEELRIPRNPLDVLAQQIVAMVAMDDWEVGELEQVVRRAAPFSGLTRPVLEAVLDMLAGRYPSEEFAELRPRLIWDRTANTLHGRPGAQRLAVTSGGTIPDRGLFGVFLAASLRSGRQSHRVGELDEEMVYESRVGDVFVLGATSWRIEDITADQVLVSPAPGQPGKLPFWHGDAPGRPVELGRALGAFCRDIAGSSGAEAFGKLAAAGLDELAAGNLIRYLGDQRDATGYLPDDRTMVMERFRDELGDWRLVLHSPFGARVHAPWALAIAARLRERYEGMDVQALHTDDGIVLRVPDTDNPPPAGIAEIAPEDIEPIVTAELGGSAMFASRFRECAARALLLPRRRPDRRSPLWQQRQRSAQLLAVASKYGSFPVVLETVRECLQDTFDVPALTGLMRDLASRKIRMVEVETPAPSPFAKSLLFRYIGAFMYEGDSPLAERRAQALALDSSLLADLLGQADLRELLDPAVVAQAEAELQRLAPNRACRDLEAVADLLRSTGPLSAQEVADRCTDQAAAPGWLEELAAARRIIEVRVAGEARWAAIEDAGRLRDALGVPLPVGVPVAFTEPVPDPLGDFVARYARGHGPFTTADVAHRYGLGQAVVTGALHRLAAQHRVTEGEFQPGGRGTEWCDVEVLRLIRRRCLAKLRKEAEPVPPEVLAAFLPTWQNAGQSPGPGAGGALGPGQARASGRWRSAPGAGPDAVYDTIAQLAGAQVPASALEALALPGRVPGYQPAILDELTSAGEIVWAGAGGLPGGDGWVVLTPAHVAPLLLPAPGEITMTGVHEAVLAALDGAGGMFFRMICDRAASLLVADDRPAPSDLEVAAAIWDLVWAGHLTNDTLAPLRTVLSTGGTPGAGGARGRGGQGFSARGGRGGSGAGGGAEGADPPAGNGSRAAGLAPGGATYPAIGSAAEASLNRLRASGGGMIGRGAGRRHGHGRPLMPSRSGPPTVSGRWSLLPEREQDPTRRLHAIAQTMLDRHGILTRGAVVSERLAGGFGALYPVLRAMEEAGQCRRGYFVEGLGAAQFALPGAVDRMRALGTEMADLAAPGPPDPGSPPRRLPAPGAGFGPPGWPTPPSGEAQRWAQGGPEQANSAQGETQHDSPGGVHGEAGADSARADETWAEGAHGGSGPASGAEVSGWAGDGPRGGGAPARRVYGPPDDGAPANGGYGWARYGVPGGKPPAKSQPEAVVLAAGDPANPFGAALPWPERPGEVPGAHRPGRKAGALVVLCRGHLVLYVERGGKTLLSWTSDPAELTPAATALATAVRGGALGRLTVERADGTGVYDTPLAQALADAGFRPTPRGLRLRG